MKKIKILGALFTLAILFTVLCAFSRTVSAEATQATDLTVTIDTNESVTLKDTDSDGFYEIGTADELYAFAAAVNGGNDTINGKLTADITVNPGTFDENGGYTAKNGESVREWTPLATIQTNSTANLTATARRSAVFIARTQTTSVSLATWAKAEPSKTSA